MILFLKIEYQKPYFKDDIKIHAHSKLVKSFKFFEKDKKVLYTLQNKASQIIQEDCVEGTLCFSVHPLDYLSISENIYNWRSCHSLSGEYRAGNLSYMQDECTVICYLKGEDNIKLPMFPDSVLWNSKKWRVLFYVHNSKELIFAGRQYPFESKSGMQQVLDIWVNKIMRKYDNILPGFFNWKDTTITNYIEKDNKVFLHDLHLPVRNKLYALPDLVQDACLSLHYNDVLYSPHCSHPNYWVDNDYYYENQFEPIIVGSAVKCLDCGKEIIADSETMRCDKCELEHGTEVNNTYTFCSCCGIRIVRDDGIEIGANDIICDTCCDNECFVCHCCDELCYNTEKHYHDGRFYCDDCYKEIMEEE